MLDGEEKARSSARQTFYKELRWKELYAKVECVGIEDVEGKPAYKVVLTPKSGKPSTRVITTRQATCLSSRPRSYHARWASSVEEFPSDYKTVTAS